MVVFIGICALLIGLAAGFRWGRGPALDAQGRRELRALRANTPVWVRTARDSHTRTSRTQATRPPGSSSEPGGQRRAGAGAPVVASNARRTGGHGHRSAQTR